jgi:plasmid maintenance system antidote protein VapI
MGDPNLEGGDTTDFRLDESDQSDRKERLAWGVISPDEMTRPGAVLTMLIFQAAHNRNLQARDACKILGITPGHFSSLRSGAKSFTNITEEFAERIAAFLGLPKVAVKLAAGQLRLEDFFYQGNLIYNQLDAALRFIISDPKFGPKMPASIFSADRDLQAFVVLLYEDATGKVVLPGKVEPQDVVQRFQALVGGEGDRKKG